MSTFVATPVACPSGVVVKYAGAGATPADIIGVNAWMQLMPGPAEAAVSASGVAFAAEPVDVPVGLTRATADRVCEHMTALLAVTNAALLVQCASGNRASAAIAIFVGRQQGWGASQTLSWATTAGLKFVAVQALRNWVALATEPPVPPPTDAPGLIMRQLWDAPTSTFTYLLGDPVTREAVIIDPVLERAERDAAIARDLDLRLTLAINTHVHADHVSGSAKLKTLAAGLRSAIGCSPGARADELLTDGACVRFGSRSLRALATPGHTGGCMSFVLDDASAVFTGDALFVRGCGRTDFQVGDSAKLFDSITRVLFALPAACIVYPGHDYNGHTRSTIGEERMFNPRVGAGRSLAEFSAIMAALNLPPPKLLDVSVPANLLDGNAPGQPTHDHLPLPPTVCVVPT